MRSIKGARVVITGAGIHNRQMAAYCASKSAVLTFSRCLRADWAGSRVGAGRLIGTSV
jgi:NAD(P)-dependent dehydrogenase (short-subunit alcohol dehydrogenase family)